MTDTGKTIFGLWMLGVLFLFPASIGAFSHFRQQRKRREKILRNAKALLDLDERKALAPHGIGGLAREIIYDLMAEID